MKLAQCLLLSLWISTSMCRASQWFVSTNGSGNGSFGSPWSLQTALTSSSIQPGDTVWLRGGTYLPVTTNVWSYTEVSWLIGINGTNGNLITLRSYTNEWAAIDRMWAYNWFPFAGGYICFRDLEFYNSLKGNEPIRTGYPDGPWVHFAWNTTAPCSIDLVNCVVHDVDNFCGSGMNSIRGCIFWHVGLPNGYEHVCYPSPQTFSGNISGWHFNDVIEHNIDNFLMQSNIIFGTGNTSGGSGGGRDVLADGGSYQIINNYFYNKFSFLPWQGYGYPQTLSYLAGNISVVNSNIIVGPSPVTYQPADTNLSVSFQGNTVYANSTNNLAMVVYWCDNSGTSTFDYNHYFSTANVTFKNLSSGVFFPTFAQWRATNSSFDIHSTASNSAVPPDSVNIIPNQDQPKRCHIAIYNWTHKDNVPVNLSGVLNAGDGYRLFSAQNYKAGAIQSGTFNGTNISVPMTNLTTAPILFGTNYVFNGVRLTQPPPTSPEFGAFVVIGSQHVLAPPEYVRVLSSGH
jgi:hypothetical protein